MWTSALSSDSSIVFDIVRECFEWAQLSATQPTSAFVSYDAFVGLDYEGYKKQLKMVATRMGIDASRIATHSLRIAGASALQHAGVTDSIIMEMGGWKSLAFLLYLRMSERTLRITLATLLNPCALSSSDVARTQIERPVLQGRQIV